MTKEWTKIDEKTSSLSCEKGLVAGKLSVKDSYITVWMFFRDTNYMIGLLKK